MFSRLNKFGIRISELFKSEVGNRKSEIGNRKSEIGENANFGAVRSPFPCRGRDLACPHMTVRSTTKHKQN